MTAAIAWGSAALVEQAGGPYVLKPVEFASLRPDEALVQIHAAGICHTDLSARDGMFGMPFPAIAGHEGAGIILEVGSQVTGVAPGDTVLIGQSYCGACTWCRRGRMSYCDNFAATSRLGSRLDGSWIVRGDDESFVAAGFLGQSSFATHAVVRGLSLVRVPADIPLRLLAPLACGVQTGAGTVLNDVRPEPGSSLAVFGVGAVGMSAVLAAKLCGCDKVIAVDVKPRRLEIARQLGATAVIDAVRDDPVAAIRDLTGGGANYVVEAAGVGAVGTQAVAATAKLGTCVLTGIPEWGTPLTVDWGSLLIGRTVRGATLGSSNPAEFIPRAIEWYRQGRFDFPAMVTTYDMADINAAVSDLISGKTLKPVLTMASEAKL